MITILLLLRVGPIKVYNQIRKEPLLTFSIVFSVFFAFSVGLTTSNFGALVRYKIPAVPFFLSSILILYQKQKNGDNNTEELEK